MAANPETRRMYDEMMQRLDDIKSALHVMIVLSAGRRRAAEKPTKPDYVFRIGK
jgi:hypothetical protein